MTVSALLDGASFQRRLQPGIQQSPAIRFGRDALFERNDRFEYLTPADQKAKSALLTLLDKPKS